MPKSSPIIRRSRLIVVAKSVLSKSPTESTAIVAELGELDTPPISVATSRLVHLLHHFIADEDIRERDQSYCEWQRSEVLKAILAVEQEDS